MQVNLEKRTDVKGKVSDFIFLVALIHSVECTAVNSMKISLQYLEGHVSKAEATSYLKTTSLHSDVCQVQVYRG